MIENIIYLAMGRYNFKNYYIYNGYLKSEREMGNIILSTFYKVMIGTFNGIGIIPRDILFLSAQFYMTYAK